MSVMFKFAAFPIFIFLQISCNEKSFPKKILSEAYYWHVINNQNVAPGSFISSGWSFKCNAQNIKLNKIADEELKKINYSKPVRSVFKMMSLIAPPQTIVFLSEDKEITNVALIKYKSSDRKTFLQMRNFSKKGGRVIVGKIATNLMGKEVQGLSVEGKIFEGQRGELPETEPKRK